MRALWLVKLSFLTMCGMLAGCEERRTTAQPIEFPFEHPACEEVRQIFLTLPLHSEEDYRQLAQRDRYLWDVCWFEVEVMNGGVDQYLTNSTGDHFAECLEALQAIGADGAYQLLRRACDLFPQGRPSPSREIRQQQLETILAPRGPDDLLDDQIQGSIEPDLYQRMLDFYRREQNGSAKSQ